MGSGAGSFEYLGQLLKFRLDTWAAGETSGTATTRSIGIPVFGAKSFPRRIARAHYWTSLETCPYIRGLRNLALALERAARWDESLAVCDRLENECGDRVSALATRSAVWIKTGRFAEAAGASQALLDFGVGIAFDLAIAQHELDQPRAALAAFLDGALH